MTKDEMRDIAAHIIVDAAFYGRACKLRAEGETVDCAKALERVNLGVRLMEDELARLRAENKRLKALLREASGHVAPDTGWSYDEPTGYLLDRIDAAMAQGKV